MRLRLETDGAEDLRGLGVGVAGLGSRARRVLQRDAQIFADRHAGERLRSLEASHDTEPGPLVGRQRGDVTTLEEDPAAVRGERAGHAIDERRLAGSVRSDEAEPLACPHGQAHPMERGEAAEALGEPVHLEQGPRHDPPQRPRRRRTSPRMPSGASTTKATSTTPTMNRFISEEIVTVASCCAVPSSTAPITGPTQLVVPPIIGIASAFTV